MGKIKVLAENIANKIAAGEVVERPASVVKELIENSLDAESDDIIVEVKNGGKELIRVIDNGVGMAYDDAVLSIERHATSKIRSVNDLESITTFGFRGEALPSIASISRMELITQQRDTVEGTKVRIEGGVTRDIEHVGSATGTRISVANLFYNVPARRKFLKSTATELDHIIRYVTWEALAHPQVSFKLISNDRTVVETRRCETIMERLYDLYGRDFADNLIELDLEFETIKIHAFVSKPEFTRSSRDYQIFFLNLRPIRSNLLGAAVGSAFRQMLPKGRYPVVIMFLEMDPKDVDVNVHPAKIEVRFRDERSVYGQVMRCLEMAMQKREYIPELRISADETQPTVEDDLTRPDHPRKSEVEASIFRYIDRQSSKPDLGSHVSEPTQRRTDRIKPPPRRIDHDRISREEPLEPLSLPLMNIGNIQIKARLFNTYIVAEADDEVLFIDQHIAEEKVIYEKLRKQMEENSVPSQGLLMPITVELSPNQASVLDSALEILAGMGFELEPFGGRTVIVRAIPSLMQRGDIKQTVMELIDQIATSHDKQDKLKLQDEILIITACRSSIQAGDEITDIVTVSLLRDLFKTNPPYLCPHGRPIIVKMKRSELDEKFQRR